jgi:hypothetical protein
MMIAGMRRRLARTWDPAASARIRPTPIRFWFVVAPASDNAEPVINWLTVHLPVTNSSSRAKVVVGHGISPVGLSDETSASITI